MPFRTQVQPININGGAKKPEPAPVMRQAPMIRLKQLFERPFSLKNLAGVDSPRDNSDEFEPSSVCLRKMVERYIEDPDSENQLQCGGPSQCNCFSSSGTDSSDEEERSSSNRVLRSLKSLLLCADLAESDLETKATEIVLENEDKCTNLRLQLVADELVALGYDAAVCKSRWTRTNSKSCPVPAGEYEYLDVKIGDQRVLIDIDFPSKFQIARQTKTYKSISQTLPYVFVGQVDRLKKIVNFVSKAASKSFKKKGLYVPPWRRAEYVLTKWVSRYDRGKQTQGETSDEASAVEP